LVSRLIVDVESEAVIEGFSKGGILSSIPGVLAVMKDMFIGDEFPGDGDAGSELSANSTLPPCSMRLCSAEVDLFGLGGTWVAFNAAASTAAVMLV
jgi:hypothetical protein